MHPRVLSLSRALSLSRSPSLSSLADVHANSEERRESLPSRRRWWIRCRRPSIRESIITHHDATLAGENVNHASVARSLATTRRVAAVFKRGVRHCRIVMRCDVETLPRQRGTTTARDALSSRIYRSPEVKPGTSGRDDEKSVVQALQFRLYSNRRAWNRAVARLLLAAAAERLRRSPRPPVVARSTFAQRFRCTSRPPDAQDRL